VLLILLVGLYGVRFDQTYAAAAWPASIGAIVGFLLSILSKKWRLGLIVAWCGFAILFVDEALSLPRMLLPVPNHDFRVVSLNCAGGSLEAAYEVANVKPDLVLLQESPSEEDLRKLTLRLYGDKGSYLKGPDASIVANGKLTQEPMSIRVSDFIAAIWTPPSGQSVKVVSLRLTPPTMRVDLYNPDAWSEFAANRKSRREEVAEIAATLKKVGFTPDIIGGDFNSPPDRAVFASLVQGLDDSFANVGRGYGATCVNPYPCVVRIDQIWAGRSAEAKRAWVDKTENSDHRMLVADFKWQ